MTARPQQAARQAGRESTFDSLDPTSGAVVGTYPVMDDAQVRATVVRARAAAAWWGELGFAERRAHLRAWKGRIARGIDELARLMHRENGKPVADATLEIMIALDHVEWAASHAGHVLRRRRAPSGASALNQSATVEYQPLGVVGVIGPWNYPVFTPLGSVAYALAAGNAVVFKPSEYTPAVGLWLADRFTEAVPRQPVLQVVTGFGATGAALCRAGVDKLAFTGSAATGRAVMAACAQTLTPVLLELGGKDAMIVDDDADLDAAADAALWGGMSNAGQTCVGVERVYVTERGFDRFVDLLRAKAERLRPGGGDAASYGPMTMPGQVEVVRRHVSDALDRGARAVVGGRESVRPPYIDPIVLVDVPPDAQAMTEETFGPTITVARVKDADEAVEAANDTRYGLAASVFGSRRAREIAGRLRAGMVSVNSVVAFAGVPALPFGGVGESGFGRIHGPDGLREFTRAKAVTVQRFPLPVPLTSFRRPRQATWMLQRLARLRHGRT